MMVIENVITYMFCYMYGDLVCVVSHESRRPGLRAASRKRRIRRGQVEDGTSDKAKQ